MEGAVGNTADGMHQAEDLAGRWAAVENEMRSLLRGMSSTNLVLRERLCKEALQAYSVSRELVKQKSTHISCRTSKRCAASRSPAAA